MGFSGLPLPCPLVFSKFCLGGREYLAGGGAYDHSSLKLIVSSCRNKYSFVILEVYISMMN